MLKDSFLDFIAPNYCEVCKTYIGNKQTRIKYLCNKCYDALPIAPPSDIITNKMITNFDNDELAITKLFSLISIKEHYDYMNLIYSLKYIGIKNIGYVFGKELAKIIIRESDTKYDCIVPVPIHRAKLRERGFNQSYYIAKGLSSKLNIPVNEKLIKRKKYTITQTKLSKEQRKVNILNAISEFKPNLKINNLRILLVDDVFTTGSTTNVCANKLLVMGAKQVDVATIVIAS